MAGRRVCSSSQDLTNPRFATARIAADLHGLQLLDVGGSVDAEQGILRDERHRGLRAVRVDHDCRWGWAHRLPGRPYGPTGRFTLA